MRSHDVHEHVTLSPSTVDDQVDWNQVLLRLEANAEASGWDQPHQVYAVYGNDITRDAFAKMGLRPPVEPGEVPPPRNALDRMISMRHLASFTEHPIERLWGMTMPDDADAALIITENWVDAELDPDSEVPLVQHPKDSSRPEIRFVTLVHRTGVTHSVYRLRGHEPEVQPTESSLCGLVPMLLARTLGLPTGTTSLPATAGDVLARIVASRLVADLSTLDDGTADPKFAAEIRAQKRHFYDIAASVNLPDLEGAVHIADAAWFMRHTLRRMADLIASATANGRELPRQMNRDTRDALREAASPRDLPVDHMDRLMAAARVLADMDVQDVLSLPGIRALLPDWMRGRCGWADDALLRIAIERVLGDDLDLLEALTPVDLLDRAGPLWLLRCGGWWTPA